MPVISLESVSKRYRIFSGQREQLKSLLSFGKGKTGRDFWALQDVSLEVEPGTTLGVVGRNGAGKSTLLKLISGVLQPTSGVVRVNGRLVALLQLGAGFNEDFTGRENIMLNGLILGIDRREIMERFDEIEAFADIGEFMDQPVKTYSSGMRGRLGFAVAVNVEPDILLVDETLATGDAVFKAKGIQKMRDLMDSGAAVVFVTHSTNQVKNFCTEAALLENGRLMSRGEPEQVIAEYEDLISKAAAKQRNRIRSISKPLDLEAAEEEEPGMPDSRKDPANKSTRRGTRGARIEKVEVLDGCRAAVDKAAPESELTVRVHAEHAKYVANSAVSITLRNGTGLDVLSTNSAQEKVPIRKKRAGKRVIVEFTFRMPLKQGR